MPNEDYIRLLEEGKVMLLPDTFPWSGSQVIDNSITEGLVADCTISTGGDIGSADIRFPKKVFGDHVNGMTPVKICLNNTDNIVFRGFIIEENGVLSESEDTVTVRALDYKWYFSKCTRIRGRWFTSDDDIPSPYGSPNTTGHGKMKYEMFRGPLTRDNGHSGYMQNEPCIFNENALPTCLTKTRAGNKSIFKYRKMYVKNSLQYVRKYNYDADYWTFSSILAHIVYWWLDPYSGNTSKIRISNNSFSQLSRLSYEDSIPMDLSIEGSNPLDAINEIVGQIPGKWIWYLTYYGSIVNIEIRNIDDTIALKKLYIGDGSKQAENPANVASINVVRNWEETSSFLVLKGGKLRFTTTVELQPVWKPNTIGGVENLPFETVEEFREWKLYLSNKESAKIDTAKRDMYEQAFRYYAIPKEGEFLTEALEAVDFNKNVSFTGRLRTMYSAVEVELKKMFAHKVFVERELDAPEHPEFENPVFFGYDEYRDRKPVKDSVSDPNAHIVYFDSGFNFDSDTGLVIFDDPQFCRFGTAQPVKTGSDEEPIRPEQGEDRDTDTTSEATLVLPNSIENINKAYNLRDTSEDTDNYPLISRRLFCTLTIVLDMPYVIGDDIFGLHYNEGGNFSRYVDFEGNDLRIHANAFYPVMPNSSVKLDREVAYQLASTGNKGFNVNITKGMCGSVLYPAEYMKDYNKYPDNNEQILFQKLDNLKESILKHKETINADLGTLDDSYELGDVIVAIENSKTENPGSGYYGIKDYVKNISWRLEGDNKGYTTALTCTNDVQFSPKDFEKVVARTVKRPSVLRGTYKASSYLKVEDE